MQNIVARISLVFFSFLTLSSQLLAQKDVNAQKFSTSTYLEVGGAGGLYSLNIEPKIMVKPQHQIGMRLGFSAMALNFNFIFIYQYKTSINTFPVLATYSWRPNAEKNHFLELGAGATFSNSKETISTPALGGTPTIENFSNITTSFTIGYRYQKPKGLMFKALIAPLIRESKFAVIPGLAIGHTF